MEKTILRLESSPGFGIYATSVEADDAQSLKIAECRCAIYDFYGTLSGKNHPTLYDDSLLSANLSAVRGEVTAFKFGFSDEKQFRKWFPETKILEILADLGVELVLYKTVEYCSGNSQAMAILGSEIWRISLHEYLKTGIPKVVDLTVEFNTMEPLCR